MKLIYAAVPVVLSLAACAHEQTEPIWRTGGSTVYRDSHGYFSCRRDAVPVCVTWGPNGSCSCIERQRLRDVLAPYGGT